MTDPRNLVDLYVRLSIDKEGKDSMTRQEDDLREWATREGLTVRKVWRDAGKSGYQPGVLRPDFDAAVAAVTSGEVRTLAVWKLDRLSRRGAGQVGTVLDALDATGGRVFFLKDSLDSSVSGHRLVIVLVSEQARAESANASVRIHAKKQADRAEGKYLGGSAPFGYTVGDGREGRPHDRKLRRHPVEAPLVREAVERLMGGETMLQVCRDWSERGVPTRRSAGHWRSSTLSMVIRSSSLAGLLPDIRRAEGWASNSKPWLHPSTGQPVSMMAPGETAIVTEGERLALLKVLDSRLRQYGRGLQAVKQPTSVLGGGLVKCATCGRTANSFGKSYRCPKRDYVGDDCTRPMNVTLEILDDAVKRAWAYGLAALEPGDPILEAVAERWAVKVSPSVIGERASLTEQLATLESRLSDADAAHYVSATLTAERHAMVSTALSGQISALTARLAALPPVTADISPLLDPELSLPAIMGAPPREAQALLRLAFEKVTVTPAPGPGARFVAHERITLKWVGQEADVAA